METVQVDLPLALVQTAKLDAANLSADAARLLALELFREERVSLGRAAELCGTPLSVFMEFATAHDVSPLRYSDAELDEDQQTLLSLGL
jgi:predicted HTH domain antitoxin